jgi:hypothetical protein
LLLLQPGDAIFSNIPVFSKNRVLRRRLWSSKQSIKIPYSSLLMLFTIPAFVSNLSSA